MRSITLAPKHGIYSFKCNTFEKRKHCKKREETGKRMNGLVRQLRCSAIFIQLSFAIFQKNLFEFNINKNCQKETI